MIKTIKFWLYCSRAYTLPMTIFSWLIIFIYCLKHNGNIMNGILGLFAICIAHLSTNLIDDYFDFKNLKKNKYGLINVQRGKCNYLTNNLTTQKEVLKTIIIYLFIVCLIGLYFLLTVGKDVLIYAILSGIIILFYSKMSNNRLSEIAVGLIYGPLLYGGINYIMTKTNSIEIFLLSIFSTIFTLNLIYTDTLLDYDIDKKENKKTFVGLFSKNNALFIQKSLLILGYLSIFPLYKLHIVNIFSFLTYLTIPFSIDLINSMKEYTKDFNNIPQKNWYHFPFEKWEEIKQNRSQQFMFRMYQARNLMIYNSIILSLSILIK